MKEHDSCPDCQSQNLKVLDRYSKDHLVQCQFCTLVFSRVIPEKRQLENYYEQYGRDDYQSPITSLRYRQILKEFEDERKLNSLLDIGCGIGYFLQEAKTKSWNCFGTEFSTKAATICREKGIKIYEGELENIDFGDQKFDIITSFELIEHLIFPSAHVEKIYDLLRPGGILYITTPNFNSLNRRLLKDKWNVIVYPEHLSYFTKKSMDYLLSNYGFKKINLITEGISPERLMSSLKNFKVDHSSDQTSDEQLRNQIEGNGLLKAMKNIANSMLNSFELGESLKATYRKL